MNKVLRYFEQKQMRNQAQKDLVEKLRLERTFKVEIKSLFNRMTNDFKIQYSATGQSIRANTYSNAWQDLLKKHYARAQKRFLGNAESQLKQLTPDQSELLELALLDYRNSRATDQERFITVTTDNNIFLALQEARQSLEEQDEIITSRSLALAATVILKRKQAGRVAGIAIIETQAPAESTKLFEARTLSGLAPSRTVAPIEQILRPAESELTKTWITIGDQKVRTAPFSHVAANNMTVAIDVPYIVGGQELDYPGDNSRGASIENTIN